MLIMNPTQTPQVLGADKKKQGKSWVKGVSAYLVLWKDIDYDVMSQKFVYIVASR